MKVEEYRAILHEEVSLSASANMSNPSDEFLKIVTDTLSSADEFDDFVECYYEGVTRRKSNMRIDGYAMDETDGSCCIFIADYHGPHEGNSITSEDIKSAFKKIRNFVEESIKYELYRELEESTGAYEFSRELHQEHENITKFRFFMLTDAFNNQRTKNLKDEQLNAIPVELNVWDISRLFDIVNSTAQKESIEILLSDGIPCVKGIECSNVTSDVLIEVVDEGDETTSREELLKVSYTSYLAVVPGQLLCNLYLEYGSRLLEGNVRSFLSTRGKVNTSIRNSIVNCPEMFFAYNNGIAATATELDTEIRANGLVITRIKDLQIVNGGQTTASIANAWLHPKRGEIVELDRLKVPMKISVLNQSMSEKIIPKISEYSNSQNKIDNSDFFSNHPFHIRMENFSEKTPAPAVNGNQYQQYWFYERTRGKYNQGMMKLSPAEIKRYKLRYPEKQVIKLVELAKYMEIFEGKPDKVSKGKQAIVREFAETIKQQWQRNNEKFNVHYFKRLVAIAIIFQSADKIIKQSYEYKSGNKNSYKANVIAYMLSIIFRYVEENKIGKTIDFMRIWDSQNIYPEFIDQLNVLWPEVYDFITDDRRPTKNVTEWCKKEDCWKRAQKESWSILPEFLNTLVSKDDSKDEEENAAREQQSKNEAENIKVVWGAGKAYWENVLAWGNENKLLFPTEKDHITAIVDMYSSGHMPSEKLAKIVLKARERLIKEGMPNF